MLSFKQYLEEALWTAAGYIVGPNGKWFKITERTHSAWVNKNYKKIGVELGRNGLNPFVEGAVKQGAVRIVLNKEHVNFECRESAINTPKIRKACGDFYEKECYGARVVIYSAAFEDGGDDDVDTGELLHDFTNADDAMEFFNTGKVVKRSDIGRTMAMFR